MVEHGRSTAKPRYAAGKKVDGKLLKAERTSSSESSCFHPWVFLSKRERGFSADVMRTLESFVPPPPDGKTEAAMQRALDLLKTEVRIRFRTPCLEGSVGSGVWSLRLGAYFACINQIARAYQLPASMIF